MRRSNSIKTLILGGFLLVAMFFFLYSSELPMAGYLKNFLSLNPGEREMAGGRYFSLVDEGGREIDATSRVVSIGDELIAVDNTRYRVVKVRENKAFLKSLGLDGEMAALAKEFQQIVPANAKEKQSGSVEDFNGEENDEDQEKPKFNRPVAIYHTHTDESYVPTDGRPNIPAKGGIYKVGETFSDKLEELGVPPKYDRTPHDPHDANAYYRSRRTVMRLMKDNPVALVDIHRDGVPDPNRYSKRMYGTKITKIQLVVGRQNPQMKANLWFAKKVKAIADQTHPGTVKGIFLAKGNYNQDLSPRAILIEVGTHTNLRGAAQNGAALFADAIPDIIREVVPQAAVQSPAKEKSAGVEVPEVDEGSGAWAAVGWLLAITVFGGAVFLLVSAGSVENSVAKVKQFFTKEFVNALGVRNRKKKSPDKQDKNLL
ncbi:MAG: stage II sporulation protein P [Clostridia bacterium]|nr:stage II sporulation protein P [Clostridia bacterium]